ncbi:MAG: hypothetical protein EOO52_13750 [Gammaproteobacteria bacterium]|nr:MAG: hypothetical protein EOO52_13750 [Gammaproteobacteria bacterium]
MHKFFVTITLVCLLLFCFVGMKVGLGPFIYLHPAPPKLTLLLQRELSPMLDAARITSMSFGRADNYDGDLVDVEVFAGRFHHFKIANPRVGRIKILFDLESKNLRVFCEIPEQMPFNQVALSILGTTRIIVDEVNHANQIDATYH